MDGQIGGTGENYLTPRLLEGFFGLGSRSSITQEYETKREKPLKISSIKVGGMMSLTIDDLGSLWMWGNCPHPSQNTLSEGEFALRSSSPPLPVWDFHGHTVVNVACGNDHVISLVSAGEKYEGGNLLCYSWVGNSHGQLGLGDTKSRWTPEILETFNLESPCVVSSNGEVWSCGMEKGLGLCPDARFTGTESGDAIYPILIPYNGIYDSLFPEPLQVACGAAHTILVADSGFKLCSCGRGRSGVLGNESEVSNLEKNEDFKGSGEKNVEGSSEVGKRLSAAMAEMKLLRSKLSVMERYASMLHGSIFGRPLQEHEISLSLEDSGKFDVAKEWEKMVKSSDVRKLAHMEMFYRNMLTGVKDKMMKKKIQDVKEWLRSNAYTNNE
ncbi:hypothetical protein OROMI_024235 [Orobanche minor]